MDSNRPDRRWALGWAAATAVVLVVLAVVGTSYVLERRGGDRSATPAQRVRQALRSPARRAEAQRALEELTAVSDAGREPFLELLAVLEPDEARQLAAVLAAWPAWNSRTATLLARAIDASDTAARLTSGSPASQERWRAALIALYGSELLGRLRGGEPLVPLVDAAAKREGTPLPIDRLVAAFHLGAAAIRAGIPTLAVVEAGEALLDRTDPEDRAAGAELVRLNAVRLADPQQRRRVLARLLAAAQREESRRTFFFLADGLAALNASPGSGEAFLGVAELRPVYEPASYRWRSACLVAVRGNERQAELRRLVRALPSEALVDDALGATQAALTLGDAPVQLEALDAWASCAGAREPQAFTDAILHALWRDRPVRENTQRRILAWIDAAARRADASPDLAHLLLTNAAFLSDDAGFRERLVAAELRWVTALDGDGFWRALLAWGQLLPAADLPKALKDVAAHRAAGPARERLQAIAEAPAGARRAHVAAYLAVASGSEADWWRFVSECCGG